MMVIIPIAFAIQECQRTTLTTNIPCDVESSWKPSNCNQYLEIYNSSNVTVASTNWTDAIPFCHFTFNITQQGIYFYNSSIDSGVITVVGDDKMIFLLFIPLMLCFFFVYWGNSLKEEQEPLKWFMRLLSIVMIFATFGGANMIIAMSPAYEGLQSIFNFTPLTWIFYTLISIFMCYFLYKLFMSFKNKRQKDFEDGVMR